MSFPVLLLIVPGRMYFSWELGFACSCVYVKRLIYRKATRAQIVMHTRFEACGHVAVLVGDTLWCGAW